jgi:tRNA-modifying protein YgfZ
MPSVLIDNRAFIGVSGADAQHFLHNLVTADIEGLPAGEWRPSSLLTAQGKVQFAFLIARAEAGYQIDCDTRDAADLHKRLKFYRLRAKVDLSEPLAGSAEVVWDEAPPAGASRDSRFGSFPVWRSQAEPSRKGGTQNWDALRIQHGVAEPHTDYTYNDVFPHDINLDQIGGVSFKKGCYVGQEVVSRMQHRGTARRRLMIAESETVLVYGAEVVASGKPAGSIGTVSGASGLAMVRLDRVKDALDSGLAVTAGGSAIKLSFPTGVSYGWPETGPES